MKSDKNIPETQRATVPSPQPSGTSEDEHEYAKPLLTLKQNSRLIRRTMLALPAWITPNGVTVFRALLIVPVVRLIVAERFGLASAVLACAMTLDFVDGALAEARNQKTETGAFLDPLADKALTCGTFLFLLPKLPGIFAPAVLVMCALAAFLTLARVVKMSVAEKGLPAPSVAASAAGKLKLMSETAALALAMLGIIAGWPVCAWLSFAALVLSLWFATRSLIDQARK